eukprot:TRINITY_DN5160_c0_g1_i3.p1 TRINITY_DN5160_c0_g1~~TRINITY_DN5160_c0_g1_i3.p1  ORF type:complete len:319 (-),score=63.56 TRINITY_DN5160_c0_g1_i3:77-1033(-)
MKLFGVLIFSLAVSCKNLGDVPPGRYDRTAEFFDRTLYIEYLAKNSRGNWLGIQKSNYQAYLTPVPESYVYIDPYVRLQAFDCGEGTICLRNRWTEFDATNPNFWVLKSKPAATNTAFETNPAPEYYNDYKWKVYCTSQQNTDACYLCDVTQTALSSEWICLFGASNKYLQGSSLAANEHNWRIVTHNAMDNGYSVGHFDLCNDMEAAVYMNYRYCVGIEVPLFSNWVVTSSMASEMKEAISMDIIQSSSSNHANDWANEMYNPQTFAQENCSLVEIPIPPRSAVTVQQLTASYGPFLVKSQKLNIIEKENAHCDSRA